MLVVLPAWRVLWSPQSIEATQLVAEGQWFYLLEGPDMVSGVTCCPLVSSTHLKAGKLLYDLNFWCNSIYLQKQTNISSDSSCLFCIYNNVLKCWLNTVVCHEFHCDMLVIYNRLNLFSHLNIFNLLSMGLLEVSHPTWVVSVLYHQSHAPTKAVEFSPLRMLSSWLVGCPWFVPGA